MKNYLRLAVAIPLLAGCAGSFPSAITAGGNPTPTPSASPTPTSSPTPTPAPGGGLNLSNGAPVGTIYFTTNYGRSASDPGKDQLFAVRADGSGRTLVAEAAGGTGATGLFFIALSPDGKFIAYGTSGVNAANQNTYLAKADGTGKRALITGGYAFDLAFTPNGQHVAYLMQSPSGSSRDVVIEGTDGSGKRVATTGTFSLGTLGAFGLSAEGSKLVASGDSGLFVEGLDGTGRVTLASTEFQVTGRPFFSPDGTRVAVSLIHRTNATRTGVYVLNADGTTNLATTTPVIQKAFTTSLEGWTPGGQLIYSTAALRPGLTQVETYEWFVASADGSGERSLARWTPLGFNNINDVGAGELSPDKSQLVYSSGELFRVLLTGGAPQQLTNTDPGSSWFPTFNSDGSRITFVSNRDQRGTVPGGNGGSGVGTLYVMNADGSGQTRLIDGFSADQPEAFRKVTPPTKGRTK